MSNPTSLPLRQRSSSIIQQVAARFGHLAPPQAGEEWRTLGRFLNQVKDGMETLDARVGTIEYHKSTSHSPIDSDDYEDCSQTSQLNRMERQFDQLELHQYETQETLETFGKDILGIKDGTVYLKENVETLELRQNKMQETLELITSVSEARQRNRLVTRFWQPVAPVGIIKTDSDGSKRLLMPLGPARRAKFYWKLHQVDNVDKLTELLLFYDIDYNDWAFSDSDDSDIDDDCLDSPSPYPSSLSAAVRLSPKRAIFALFSEIGLDYSIFSDQVTQAALREQKCGIQKTKASSKKETLGQMPPKRQRNTSPGSTTEIVTSSTQSTTSAL